jgi:hypothetical protein
MEQVSVGEKLQNTTKLTTFYFVIIPDEKQNSSPGEKRQIFVKNILYLPVKF